MDEKTGRPLNNNLLDYKIPTAMDAPDLHVEFIQLDDPTGLMETSLWVSHLQSRLRLQ